MISWYEHLSGRQHLSETGSGKKNPKRLQREISRARNKPAVSTKAQTAMQEMHENLKKESRIRSRQQREAEKRRKYQLKQQKRKGH
ncbi:DUF2992 family protein [Streptococcus chenjunshii]|uniref:DUF2992 family protein n=1 Tax=Streptococcus chenjunshii TaxID=2173853 RepID=A0A372KM90_9STRE|nr:DUF2992 family protein [Streptococcus chenjunshii]AXQ79643.1 DUF2992 family protein [Streptococcus chenjunshii]RFU51042.1 DUF2992 family protein [Streptococcus chenjunshii]RFU53086.1 DUF2992 family protein [Streptococcus chenjunshii]